MAVINLIIEDHLRCYSRRLWLGPARGLPGTGALGWRRRRVGATCAVLVDSEQHVARTPPAMLTCARTLRSARASGLPSTLPRMHREATDFTLCGSRGCLQTPPISTAMGPGVGLSNHHQPPRIGSRCSDFFFLFDGRCPDLNWSRRGLGYPGHFSWLLKLPEEILHCWNFFSLV
jgi:hypothetical protein